MIITDELDYRLSASEQRIIDLLLQGCTNEDIAKEVHIAERTVKARFHVLFDRFHIKSGDKRVKLAVLFFRRQLCR